MSWVIKVEKEALTEKVDKVVEELGFVDDLIGSTQSALVEYKVIINNAKEQVSDPLLKMVLAMIVEMMDFAEAGLETATDIVERCRNTLNEVSNDINMM